MPPFEPFSHYLAYGATDQETLRELRDMYSGILVPATIAAFQRQGTGGFVLSLSATEESPPYMIDSRFPLFQQRLEKPKKSHTALAELLDDPQLVVTDHEPAPVEFPDDRIDGIARHWVTFNLGYGQKESANFDKYAKRLGKDVRPEEAKAPEAILAPYFACRDSKDPWWERSIHFFESTKQRAGEVKCLRVVCALTGFGLDDLLGTINEPAQVVIWVSDLDEHNTTSDELLSYRKAVENAAGRGHDLFALYGGFFSVLLGIAGLKGASHGIGFSEHRSWRELPQSGAPPARYYLRRLHRYVVQDLAQVLYEIDPAITECSCPHCNGRPPIALDYHELMKHSVWCRDEEIQVWYGTDLKAAAEILRNEYEGLTQQITKARLVPRIRGRALDALLHLPEWAAALEGQ
jgi:hypothetical protein